MHDSSYRRMEWFVENYLLDFSTKEKDEKIKVIDIGAYDVNGTYKPLFDDSRFEYTGFDMAKGPNVDITPDFPYDWKEIVNDTYDVVISGQCLEHIEFPWVTMEEMTRILKPGGLMCIIAPRGVPRHRYPVDTYRYDADGMAALAKYAKLEPLHISTGEAPPTAGIDWFIGNTLDSMLVARKPKEWDGVLDIRKYRYIKWPIEKLRGNFLTFDTPHPCRLRENTPPPPEKIK